MMQLTMKEDLCNSLRPIVDAISFDSNQQLFFANTPVLPASQAAPYFDSGNTQSGTLRDVLYQQCYCHRFNDADKNSAESVYSTEGDDLTANLSAANTSRDGWDMGWKVESIEPSGRTIVVKQNRTRRVWPGEFITEGSMGFPLSVGTSIKLFKPRESVNWQPGFYFAFGETLERPLPNQSLLRYYWNVKASGVENLISAVTRTFNRYQIPFRFKCSNLRSLLERIDTAVLYVGAEHFRLSSELALSIQHQLENQLGDHTPLFSLQLAPGLGFAQNPASGESFGMDRCNRLASSIVNALQAGILSPEDRLNAVVNQIESDGLDLNRPHLNPGAPDLFSSALVDGSAL